MLFCQVKDLTPRLHPDPIFIVEPYGSAGDVPAGFTLYGAGWGHGVGLCQIGAAGMAEQGKTCEEILSHYFKGAKLTTLY